jgi:hypothetical protein
VTVHFIPCGAGLSEPSDQVSPLRLKTNFTSPFNPITPVQSSRKKYSVLCRPQITSTLPRIPPHEEGRFAIVTNVEAGSGGRDGSRVSLTPTNELIRLRGDGDGMVPTPLRRFSHKAFADGQAVWSWRPDAGAKFPERATRALGVTGAKEPGPRGERGVSRQPIAQGRPGVSG